MLKVMKQYLRATDLVYLGMCMFCSMLSILVLISIGRYLLGGFDTDEIAQNLKFFEFKPEEKWHGFDGYGEHQYFVDPCKFLLTTPGINAQTGEYEDFGVPATLLANYLRENHIIPEKADLNSILFLMTPAEDMAKMTKLVEQIKRFEDLLEADAPMSEVLPSIYAANEERYRGYTMRRLCQEMHDICRDHNVKQQLKDMFRKVHFPKVAMLPQQAHYEYIRGHVELVPLSEAEGRIAAEGALPYPPGILCCVPGEVWGGAVLKYFLGVEETLNLVPGFTPELQGVYIQTEKDGTKRIYAYVIEN